MNRHRARVAATLQDGNREFTAHQEAGFFAVGGNQVGFGEDLKDALGLQRFHQRAQVEVAAESEDVECVADRKLTVVVQPGPAELLGTHGAQVASGAGGKKINSKLLGYRPVELGEADLKDDLFGHRCGGQR